MKNIDATEFETEVLIRSRQLPVLVDFWADWCQPCKMLHPILQQLQSHFGNALAIVKVNTDEQRELAGEHDIQGLPTLVLFVNGEAVERITGVHPQQTLMDLIQPHITTEADTMREQALQLMHNGDTAKAETLLQEVVDKQPQNYKNHRALASVLMAQNKFAETESFLAALPIQAAEHMGKIKAELAILLARGDNDALESTALDSAVSGGKADMEMTLAWVAEKVLQRQYEAALEKLFPMLAGSGRKHAHEMILHVFTLIEESHPELVKSARRKMFAALH